MASLGNAASVIDATITWLLYSSNSTQLCISSITSCKGYSHSAATLGVLPTSLQEVQFRSSAPHLTMIPLATADYIRAVSRCRRTHKFFFLDLPKDLRIQIYEELFLGNTVNVCSWLKSHQGEYAEDERCQILLTCRFLLKEAAGYFYFLSRWKFQSMASLQFFTWPDISCTARWENITKITLTKTENLDEFSRHQHKFTKLQMLTLDVPRQFKVQTGRRARKEEQVAFVHSLLARQYYVLHLHPYLYIKRQWETSVVIRVTYGTGTEEIVLVNVDRCTVLFNYYPIPAKESLYVPNMPCSEDNDVEYTMIAVK